MKQHDGNYTGKSIRVATAKNGYIADLTGVGSETRIFRKFDETVNYLAQSNGLLLIGEKVRLVSNCEHGAGSLFEFLAHGSPEHREWLKQAIRAWVNGDPAPSENIETSEENT